MGVCVFLCFWLFGLASRLSSLLVSPASWSPASWLLPLLGFSGFLASPASWLLRLLVLALRLLGFSACSLLGFLASGRGFSASPASWLSSWLRGFTAKKSCHHHTCSKGRLCGSFCLRMGGLRPPSTPPIFSKPSMLMVLENHGVRIILLANWGIAAPHPPPPAAAMPPRPCFLTVIHADG